MLTKIIVNNFAIIEDIEISFKDGLTVLTGETGAGKSLIIDSIALLLGDRANNEMIRNGKEKATVLGYFSSNNIHVKGYLNKLGIDVIDNEIVVSRTISNTKNVVKINNVAVNLQDLKVIAPYLADIHMQFDMQKLLDKNNYLGVIDGFRFELIESYKQKYRDSLLELKNKQKEYISLKENIERIKNQRDVYEYEYNELKSFGLRANEEEKIEERLNVLKNFDKIYTLFQESKELIDKDFIDYIYTIKENVNKIKEYQPSLDDVSERLNNSYYELEDIFETLKEHAKEMDYDPKEFEELETRQSELRQLKKKYNKNSGELLEYFKELEALLNSKEDNDIALNKLREELSTLYDETYTRALDLSKVRKENAKNIEKEICTHLSDLALKSNFSIVFTIKEKDKELDTSIFSEEGIDDIDFLIETNIGEGLKPLAKVVSGGEASRIMLALKMIFIKSARTETVIFDEIDTGISGESAVKVAKKIYELSLNCQVIIITHLPQVAAFGKNHLKIYKKEANKRTYTYVKELSLDEKVYEIALLISDGKVSEKQIEYAKELIANSII